MKMILVLGVLTALMSSCLTQQSSDHQGYYWPDQNRSTNLYLIGQSNANPDFGKSLFDMVLDSSVLSMGHAGQPITEWTAGTLLNYDMAFLDNMNVNHLDYIVWFQGENDWDRAEHYGAEFNIIYTQYKRKFPSVKFIMVQVYDTWGTFDAIRAVQKDIVRKHNDIILVDSSLLERIDRYHVSKLGSIYLAEHINSAIIPQFK